MSLISCREVQSEICLGIRNHKTDIFDLRTNISQRIKGILDQLPPKHQDNIERSPSGTHRLEL